MKEVFDDRRRLRPQMLRAHPVRRDSQAVQAKEAVRKAWFLWTGGKRRGSGERPFDPPVPVLTPQQYRFLRFLLDMSDKLAARDGALDGSEDGLDSDRSLARIRAAVRLFEQTASSPDRGDTAE